MKIGIANDHNGVELKQELTKDLVDGKKEKYQLTWPGKKDSLLNQKRNITKQIKIYKNVMKM